MKYGVEKEKTEAPNLKYARPPAQEKLTEKISGECSIEKAGDFNKTNN